MAATDIAEVVLTSRTAAPKSGAGETSLAFSVATSPPKAGAGEGSRPPKAGAGEGSRSSYGAAPLLIVSSSATFMAGVFVREAAWAGEGLCKLEIVGYSF